MKTIECQECGAAHVDHGDGDVGELDASSGRRYCFECGAELPESSSLLEGPEFERIVADVVAVELIAEGFGYPVNPDDPSEGFDVDAGLVRSALDRGAA